MPLKVTALFIVFFIAGCANTESTLGPIETAAAVSLERFAGDWYVIGNIPTPFERDVFNAVESYGLPDGNRIATTFSFNKGASDGPRKTWHPTGFVRQDGSNAVWGMQFIWPFKAEYRILFVDPDYQQTIIGRSKRDYLWIMARTPSITAGDYERHLKFVSAQGYDVSKIRRVPQRSE